jgi:hypothetical protein
MAYFQERMVHYLTCDPRLFVAEERILQYGKDKNKDFWYIDAFVVSPWERTFYLGEATYNLKPTPLLKKLHVFAERYDEVMKLLVPESEHDKWVVRPWLFLRKRVVADVIKHLPANLTPRISCLEVAAFRWKYEKLRQSGKEPKVPRGVDIPARFRE